MKDYLRILFKRKMLFIVPLLVILLGGLVIVLRLPKTYSTVAIIRRETSGVIAKAGEPALVESAWPQMQPQEVKELVLSKPNIEHAMKAADLYVKGDDAWAKRQREIIAKDVLRRTSVQVAFRSAHLDIVRIGHRGENPEQVAKFCNALATAFVEQTIESTKNEARKAHEVAKEAAEAAARQAAKAKENLEKFEKENFERLQKTARQAYLEYEELRRDLSAIDEEIKSLKSTKELLAKRVEQMPRTQVKRQRFKENPAYRNLLAQLDSLKAKRDELLLTRTELHPEVQLIDRRIAGLNKELKDVPSEIPDYRDEETNEGLASIEDKILAIDAKIDALETRRDERQQQVADYEKAYKAQRLIDEEHQRLQTELASAEYWLRQATDRENRAKQTLKTVLEERGSSLAVWQPAEVPQRPDGPRVFTYALLSLILGLGVGLGLVFLAELGDTSFRSYDDARAYLSVPVVGAIAAIETPQERLWRKSRARVLWGVGLAAAGLAALIVLMLIILSIHDPSFFVRLLDDPFEGIGEALGRVFGRIGG